MEYAILKTAPKEVPLLPHVHQITKYDPADRDGHGYYAGPEDTASDHGPVEAAYLEAVRALAEASGVDHLEIREPELTGPVHFGLEPAVEGHGLDGILDPADFHDGARVCLATALELVRAMLRDHGLWCRLEAGDRFAVHVGWDQYLYVSTARPCPGALSRVRGLGLFPERLEASPYDACPDEEPGGARPADEVFWQRLSLYVSSRWAGLLEEQYATGASRWHRLAPAAPEGFGPGAAETRRTLDRVRAALAPRARLLVWPELSPDVGAVLSGLPGEGLISLVWEDREGLVHELIVDGEDHHRLPALLDGARAATARSAYAEEDPPLFTGVLPDADGVLRARWRTDPCPGDAHWEFLRTLRRGQVVTGTVVRIAPFHVTFVDIGGFTAMVNVPELSWRPFDLPADVVREGQRVRAEILDVDLVRERVSLSLKALEPDPMRALVRRIGRVVAGTVTKVVPFGVFVRVEDRPDGFEGLVHRDLLPGFPESGPVAGDPLSVRLLAVDTVRRRIGLEPEG
ncbi:S1 RNA-binding domain-containing protein [Nocardiopsis terrae]